MVYRYFFWEGNGVVLQMLTAITRFDGYLARQQLSTAFVRFSFGHLSALIGMEV